MTKVIGISSPGDMGGAIGWTLRQHGARSIAALDERSDRTRQLAEQAGIEDVGSVERMVREADIILSVLVPSEATAAAERVAAAVRQTGARLLYADCNAISPGTTKRVGEIVEAAGARYVDASIIGPPPRKPGATKIYASGAAAGELAELSAFGLDIRVLGDVIGQASGIKMCYAAFTKGVTALATELLVTGRRLGLEEPLRAELLDSQAKMYEHVGRSIPSMPPKAHRWIGEMEEIAATFEQVGLTPRILLGAADMYALIAQTSLGVESPEERDLDRGLDGVIDTLAAEMGTVAASR
jgi:3-hydroxyisobutyrate dehydrogenase-like beta-hydroxyacid dehydrogenase